MPPFPVPKRRRIPINAKQELAGRIIMLAYDEIKPDTQRVLDLLTGYRIDHSTGIEEMDFLRQVNHFLGAKKSEGMADRTISNYRLYLGMLSDYLGKKASEITSNDIRDFIMYMSDERGMKTNSIQSVINILRSYFSWMHGEELIPKNPMTRIKSFKINKKDARHPLTLEELEKLRNACKTYREKAIVEFFFSSGCRISEAIQIDVNSLDMTHRCADVIGKGNKPRTLYFSIRARLMIEEYLKERKGGTALFCCGRKPYARLGKRSIEKILQQIGERAGIVRRVHPHVLRHTFATHMLNSGMDITVIQKLLGHSSVGTTEIYAEINQDGVRREYDKFIT